MLKLAVCVQLSAAIFDCSGGGSGSVSPGPRCFGASCTSGGPQAQVVRTLAGPELPVRYSVTVRNVGRRR